MKNPVHLARVQDVLGRKQWLLYVEENDRQPLLLLQDSEIDVLIDDIGHFRGLDQLLEPASNESRT